ILFDGCFRMRNLIAVGACLFVTSAIAQPQFRITSTSPWQSVEVPLQHRQTKPPDDRSDSPSMSGRNLPENLVCFDYHRADLQWDGNGWRVCAGYQTIKEFGKREKEARRGPTLIRDLQLTERGVIGTPYPIMEYWLSRSHAPRTPARGVSTLPIDLESLRVEENQGLWCVRDAHQVLFGFGSHEADATQALQVIR